MSLLKILFYRFVAFVSVSRIQAAWILLALTLIGMVVAANPAKFLVGCWIGAKIVASALLGAGLFRAFDTKPETLDGIEAAMAHTRRATLMAAAIICAGLAP